MLLSVLLFETVTDVMSRTRLPMLETNYEVPRNTPEAQLKGVLVAWLVELVAARSSSILSLTRILCQCFDANILILVCLVSSPAWWSLVDSF